MTDTSFIENPERQALRKSVAALAANYGQEYYLERARSGGHTDELWREAGQLGFVGVNLPEEYGGGGAGMYELALVMEELSAAGCPLLMLVVSPAINGTIIAKFGTEEQRKQWLTPLLAGEIRSAFSMTEPAVASSDARNIQTEITRDGDDYIINGRKWWTSGANDPRCKVLIVMGRTNPDAASHQQQSMILVPVDTPGVNLLRSTSVFGWQDQHGHAEVVYSGVRVPASNLLAEEGMGFAIAQARLGPGRIHHCMRAIGVAERALALMTERARTRIAFGKPLAEQGMVQQQIALSRNEIDQARLLCEKAAWTIDQHGNRAAFSLVSQIKSVAPLMACTVIDRAIQVHGGAGVSDDFPLARMYGWQRAMRIFDGPDEVHLRTIARAELGRDKSPLAVAVTGG